MQQQRRPRLSSLIVGVAAFAAATAASAAGFGVNVASAVMGQPLDFVVPLRLDPGELMAPECINAEVTVGDRQLPSSLVQSALEMQGADVARVRVITLQNVDEPVVAVQVIAGCSSRVSRRFTVLADPPLRVPAVAHVPVVAPVAVVAPAYAAALPDAASVDTAAALGETSNTRSLLAAPAAIAAVAANVAAGSTSIYRARSLPVVRRVAQRDAARAKSAAAVRVAVPAARRTVRNGARAGGDVRRAAPADPTPRLHLESPEPSPSVEAVAIEQALQVVAQAASAARASASAASAASERIATLERAVGDLTAQARGSRELAAELRARLAGAEVASRWIWPLTLGVLLLSVGAVWLALRVSALQRERARGWGAAATPGAPGRADHRVAPPGGAPDVAPTEPNRHRAAPPWPPAVAADAWSTQPMTVAAPPPVMASVVPIEAPTTVLDSVDRGMDRTDILSVPGRPEDQTPRDVSIEELIDLEQQAEFFVVLGQDDAAVDLLVEHLRNTGGGSPLPYLKLLEIYRRCGDHGNYERTRVRFNQRFNAYAPDWNSDLGSGRTLEDYPGVLPRLQQVWGRPLDAMAELEALLFRKSRGELFDLPAYREVLFLYALSRDLLDREAADTGNVDLLLPLSESTDFGSTAPGAFMGLERTGGDSDHAPLADERPTQPVDLDLSAEIDRPTSIFDPIEEPEPRARRR